MGHERFTIPAPTRHKLTTEEFLALDEAGFFLGKGRFELIDGEIYKMSPLHVPHARAFTRIGAQVTEAIRVAGLDLEIIGTVSMQLGRHSLPEPDMVIVSSDVGDKFVEIETARVAIEISASSLRHDLKRKANLYARHGVPEYWVVDLKNLQLHQMTEPGAKGYTAVEIHPFGARVASRMVPQIVVDTSRIA